MRISAFSLWAPNVETLEEWEEHARGKRPIEDSSAAPKLGFASPIQTRRLSQLTRMTAYMFHKLKEGADGLFFTSIRGEIAMQRAIDTAYARDGELTPAPFSISVFNAAPAQATILSKSQIPCTPIYSGEKSAIRNLWLAGTASLKSKRAKKNVLIYAEERCPDEYRANLTYSLAPPMCIGLCVVAEGDETLPEEAAGSPSALVSHLLTKKRELWV